MTIYKALIQSIKAGMMEWNRLSYLRKRSASIDSPI
jgi:hypothetical protein